MTPSAPARPAAARPAHDAYLRHLDDGHTWGRCCRDLLQAADIESGRRVGWPIPDQSQT